MIRTICDGNCGIDAMALSLGVERSPLSWQTIRGGLSRRTVEVASKQAWRDAFVLAGEGRTAAERASDGLSAHVLRISRMGGHKLSSLAQRPRRHRATLKPAGEERGSDRSVLQNASALVAFSHAPLDGAGDVRAGGASSADPSTAVPQTDGQHMWKKCRTN